MNILRKEENMSISTSVIDLTIVELRLHINAGIQKLKEYEETNGIAEYEFEGNVYSLRQFELYTKIWDAVEMRRWLLAIFPNDYHSGRQGRGMAYGRRENRGI
jgi:hypothetical protein